MLVVDAHQHLWQPAPGRYTWIPRGHPVLDRGYTQADVRPAFREAGIELSVLVQAENSFDDTAAMLAVADEDSSIGGVVGWAPLTDPRQCARAIDELSRNPCLVGIRHLVHDEPDPDWVVQPTVVESLRLVAERGLTFDLVTSTVRHLEHAATLANAIPDLRLVIDHLGKPPIAGLGWEPWASTLAAAAACENVTAKISGLNTAADHELWTPADLKPYVDHALAVFGPDRLMYGGDWPVTCLAGDYSRVWLATLQLLSGLGVSERARVLGGTAMDVYRLRPSMVSRSSSHPIAQIAE